MSMTYHDDDGGGDVSLPRPTYVVHLLNVYVSRHPSAEAQKLHIVLLTRIG